MFFLFFSFLIILPTASFAQETASYLLAKKISDHYQKKEFSESLTLLQKLKREISEDFESGNPDSPIDLYLLISGIIQDNPVNLRSFLASLKEEIVPDPLKPFLTRDAIEKLSYARKSNKTAPLTKVYLDFKDAENCLIKINNQPYPSLKTFHLISGIPFFMILSCDKNRYKTKKIITSESQGEYYLFLDDFQEKKSESPSLSIEHSTLETQSAHSPQNEQNQTTTPPFKPLSLDPQAEEPLIKAQPMWREYSIGLGFGHTDKSDYNFDFKEGTYALLIFNITLSYLLLGFDISWLQETKTQNPSYGIFFAPLIGFSLQKRLPATFLLEGGAFIQEGMTFKNDIFLDGANLSVFGALGKQLSDTLSLKLRFLISKNLELKSSRLGLGVSAHLARYF